MGRDTCAAVTWARRWLGARSTTGVMAVLPADHVIPDAKKFQQILGDAFDLAAQGQAIVTIGIKPTEPATGYGYIQTGVELPNASRRQKNKTAFYKAERFVEKPNFETALEYVNSGQYRWNAGMFVWSFITVTNGWRNISRRCLPPASAGSRSPAIPPSSPKCWRRNIPSINENLH
jgi:mannose-1-phosphate guanylyltransferase